MKHRQATIAAVLLLLAAVMLGGCGQPRATRREVQAPSMRDEHGFLLSPGVTPPTGTITKAPTKKPTATPKAGTPTEKVSPTPRITGADSSSRVDRHGYRAEEILEYFDEVALRVEYGVSAYAVHKWTSPIKIYIGGTPTQKDRQVLANIYSAMNRVNGFPGISEVLYEDDANVCMYFYPDDKYDEITPSNITDLTDGFATCWFQGSAIIKSRIGIRTSMSQHERNSVIWEELVQCTGLQNDSYKYPESLFYQGYNEVQEPTKLDWILFEVLYHPAIQPGMTIDEVANEIGNILR
ncbi:MAG: DUF2927 domain-containing protein [Lachnospiraceae bacterium]|nr:DUF2927 domain-containing protein [Lachnospiraceae bacterium]